MFPSSICIAVSALLILMNCPSNSSDIIGDGTVLLYFS